MKKYILAICGNVQYSKLIYSSRTKPFKIRWHSSLLTRPEEGSRLKRLHNQKLKGIYLSRQESPMYIDLMVKHPRLFMFYLAEEAKTKYFSY
jgi:hypothetical protein